MLNKVVLVGRLESENVDEIIKIKVPRNYKNSDGLYDNDIMPVVLIGATKEMTKEYCKKGDLLGISGRIENKEDEIVIIAEKITFLSSGKKEEKEGE